MSGCVVGIGKAVDYLAAVDVGLLNKLSESVPIPIKQRIQSERVKKAYRIALTISVFVNARAVDNIDINSTPYCSDFQKITLLRYIVRQAFS